MLRLFISKISSLMRHELVSGSFFVLVGGAVASFFTYLFHLITGRFLGPEQYGVVAVLLSFSYIVGFPSAIISTAAVRKIASFSAKEDYSSALGFVIFLLKRTLLFVCLTIVLFFLMKEPIASFLRIEHSFLVFLLGVSLAIGLLTVISTSVLQGFLRFKSLAFLNLFSAGIRDGIAFVAVLMGAGIFGIMWTLVVSAVFGFFLSLYFLRDILSVKPKTYHYGKESYSSLIWIAIPLVGLSLIMNADVVLVKHFFNAHDAGLYAALSNMGKIILFASSPVISVLFPLAVKKRTGGFSSYRDLLLASVFIVVISLPFFLLYLLLPGFSVNLFYGGLYLSISPYLWRMAVYFVLFNLSSLLVSYCIALRHRGILFVPLLYGIGQMSLLLLFHRSFSQILTILIVTASLMMIHFLVFLLVSKHNENRTIRKSARIST